MVKLGYHTLIDEICLKWRFCGCIKDDQVVHVDLFVPPDGLVTADQFVEWVFLANNINPYSNPARWRRETAALRAAFVEHMGAAIVDARRLRWDEYEQEARAQDEAGRRAPDVA
jgi:hypothetical protein